MRVTRGIKKLSELVKIVKEINVPRGRDRKRVASIFTPVLCRGVSQVLLLLLLMLEVNKIIWFEHDHQMNTILTL